MLATLSLIIKYIFTVTKDFYGMGVWARFKYYIHNTHTYVYIYQTYIIQYMGGYIIYVVN